MRRLAGRGGAALVKALVVTAASLGWVAAVQASPPAGSSQDTLAPAGAERRWLPCEDWAMYHWVPYDESQLFAVLRLDRAAVDRWLKRDDIHTLAQLVRRRGLDPRAVADQLVAAWAGDASEGRQAVLRDRALRTLTQGHLAQHVFFHFAHYPAVALRARTVFGMGPLAYQRHRLAGWTPREIARHGGRSPGEVAALTEPVLRGGADRGVDTLSTPPAQAERILALQRQNLGAWLRQRIRPLHRVTRRPVPRLRSREELACWLFAGAAGLEQLRRREEPRAASLVCSLPTYRRRDQE